MLSKWPFHSHPTPFPEQRTAILLFKYGDFLVIGKKLLVINNHIHSHLDSQTWRLEDNQTWRPEDLETINGLTNYRS
jgi:hypothetical protein